MRRAQAERGDEAGAELSHGAGRAAFGAPLGMAEAGQIDRRRPPPPSRPAKHAGKGKQAVRPGTGEQDDRAASAFPESAYLIRSSSTSTVCVGMVEALIDVVPSIASWARFTPPPIAGLAEQGRRAAALRQPLLQILTAAPAPAVSAT